MRNLIVIAAVLVIAGIIAVGCLGYQLFRRSLGTMQSREDSLVQAAERQEEEEAAESLARRLSQEALAQQAALTEFYYNSSLTRKIVDAISDGTGRLPEEIVVCRDRVTGRTRGTKRVFDFLAERVDGLEHWADEAALSEAINRILGNEYQLFHGDDELYDHLVVMRLKPTQKF